MHQPSPCAAMELDARALGEACAGLFLAANQLRHSSPKETIRYLHPDSREGQFLVALFDKTTDEIAGIYGKPQASKLSESPKAKVHELGFGRMRPPKDRKRSR